MVRQLPSTGNFEQQYGFTLKPAIDDLRNEIDDIEANFEEINVNIDDIDVDST